MPTRVDFPVGPHRGTIRMRCRRWRELLPIFFRFETFILMIDDEVMYHEGRDLYCERCDHILGKTPRETCPRCGTPVDLEANDRRHRDLT